VKIGARGSSRPADLSAALGVPGDIDAPVFRDAITRIVTAARQAGIAASILSRNADHAKACLEDGFSFVGVGSDATLLAASVTAVTNRSRKAPTDPEGIPLNGAARS